MPINFDMLASNPQKSGVIARIPQSQDSGWGGTKDLIGGLASLIGHNAPQPPNNSSVPTINPDYTDRAINGTLDARSVLQQKVSGSMWDNASKELGINENDPTLTTYLQKTNPGLDPTVTPWCAGFIGSVLNASGLKGTGSLAAKSYLKYGTPTDKPSQGDIVVFNDLSGRNDPNHGHVGFVQSIDERTGTIKVLGGNQGNKVSIKSYPLSAVAGFRVPPSGKEVQQFAQQNGVTSPKQLASLTETPRDGNFIHGDGQLSNMPNGIQNLPGQSNMPSSIPKYPVNNTGNIRLASNTRQPISKYPDNSTQPPQIPTKTYEDIIRDMDRGSDYASNKQGINWGLLNNSNMRNA